MAYRRPSTAFTRYGGWIPSDERIYRGFHSRLFQFALMKREAFSNHVPAVQAFADAINKPEAGEEKSLMRTLFDNIFLQAAKEYNFFQASSHLQLRRIRH
jgi:phosphatidylserine decarboxylase